ncbi:hypothetical protein SISSUDRAFT_1060318 [Sistotremastrum suecicum HHB10207 ss-3]|uniref:Uncharacterized protein n=1 Tax=Sistotremastrum suecicum HHB10207 ss-3 TaxID=1314776 RepID=A0A166F8I7_9AGAM|nr:hypothetical protein SISSUDRAFT_1060318 [Sistotremastrum suecicum HHB10207 ss-3]
MSVLSAEAAADIASYLEAHALPDGGGYIVVEQAIGHKIPFRFENGKLLIEGVLDVDDRFVSGDVNIWFPIFGWRTVFHFSGKVPDDVGVWFDIDLFAIKGRITFKYQYVLGVKFFTMILAIRILNTWDINGTIPLFPVPFFSSPIAGTGPVNAPSAAAGTYINNQWLEQLHLFSKLALEKGAVLPEAATAA